MNKETGGPAFPQNTKIVAAAGQELHQGFIGGISVRDYFAAKAMQSILSNDPEYHQKYKFIDLADSSYRCADAMLEARKS